MATSMNKLGKMAGFINYVMSITLNDGRKLQGQMLAFDKHMNVVLADTEEFRYSKSKQENDDGEGEKVVETERKRTLGLVIIRGSNIIVVQPLRPPPQDPSARLGKSVVGGMPSLAAGPGVARPAGRGAPGASPSLAGPAAGVGPGVPPPAFGGFPGGPPPGFPGRGAPGFPPGPPGAFGGAPMPGPPGMGGFPPHGFPPGPGGPGGFQPPPRR